MSKICAYAIAKNEAARVPQFIEQTRAFDHVVVLDTGSTDQTVQMLQDAGITVHTRSWQHFDFSMARNTCASLTPADCDWLMTVDFSDKFHATPELLDMIKQQQVDGLSVNYLSSLHPEYLENKVRLHRRGRMAWRYAVHEYLETTHATAVVAHIDWPIQKQVNMPLSKRKWYAEICEREHTHEPHDAHYSWWALDYYRLVGDEPKIAYYAEHLLNHTRAYGLDWRVTCWLDLSKYWQSRNWNSAVDCAVKALAESIPFRSSVPHLGPSSLSRLAELGVTLNVNMPD